MGITTEELERLIFSYDGPLRLTQDSPIPPDVWLLFAATDGAPLDLLLVPHRRAPVGDLAVALRDRLERFGSNGHDRRIAHVGRYVTAQLTLVETLSALLPLAQWWDSKLVDDHGPVPEQLERLAAGVDEGTGRQMRWLVAVAGRILWEDLRAATAPPTDAALASTLREALDLELTSEVVRPPLLWAVAHNRPARVALYRSRQAVKADAATRTFEPVLTDLAWGVIDSGIDARHPAFRVRTAEGPLPLPDDGSFADHTRVVASYDFTRLREALEPSLEPVKPDGRRRRPPRVADELHRSLTAGRAVDWHLVEPLLRIDHDDSYRVPVDEHGTHVAGIVAGDWLPSDGDDGPPNPLLGVCAGLRLYDLRVLDDEARGEEFAILAALSFVRWLNERNDEPVIQGINISISLDHDVLNSACGRSPVCEEAEHVHDSGVVVVVAAGNEGRCEFTYRGQTSDGYRTVSITDPGNAESVITVGATHRVEPHRYGVSYFSSRGPTGDGRIKPDLVAPGEKIVGPIPGGRYVRMDGTSMAAPHVSGAAALLLARHRELIGEPDKVKQTLCGAATDLGREAYFQGAGMLDILRALQTL